MKTPYVWDFPTRLFHWLLVILIAFQYVTGEILNDAIEWHFYGGYVTLGLILFRIMWGFVGFQYSRFSHFTYSPIKVFNYAFGKDNSQYLSHNPIGTYSTLAFLAVIATQGISGLFITDDIFSDGPWHHAVSSDIQDTSSWIHGNLYNVMLALIGIHVIAILVYQFGKKQKLINAMFTGRKTIESGDAAVTPKSTRPKMRLTMPRFIICVALSIIAMYLIVEVLPPPVEDDFFGY